MCASGAGESYFCSWRPSWSSRLWFSGGDSFAPFAIAAGYIAGYAVWARIMVAGLAPTEEKLSAREIALGHPALYSPLLLWPLEIVALVFVLGGLVLLIEDPVDWPTAVGAIVFFGLCAASFAYVLIVGASRRRSGA